MKSRTLFDKIWDKHVVKSINENTHVLYIDRHFIHEVTSPQAFDGLRKRGIKPFRTNQIIATADHNVPTKDQHLPIKDELSRKQVDKLIQNCNEFGIKLFGLGHKYQGIVHVIGPELGITQPGMTIVCGDSHTSTHGAFGNIAFGIGTSEVEMVLATQCLLQKKPLKMLINVDGILNPGVTSKDIILYIIAKLGTDGGTGYFIEFAGSTIESLSMEARMSLCNMSIELGARGGLIAPDEKTFEYLKDKSYSPKNKNWTKAVDNWKMLYSDNDANFDLEHHFDASDIEPMITYGTNPGMGIKVNENIPSFSENNTRENNQELKKALNYMDFNAGEKILDKKVNYVFIGSCTNGRIEDLRAAANIINGHQKAENINAFVVPGSKQVEKQAIQEGLDKIFENAGIEFRQPGCSACLAMNEDKVPENEYCVSTSNRNFEGRQGPQSRTLLASPLTAAAVAITGKITDVRDFLKSYGKN